MTALLQAIWRRPWLPLLGAAAGVVLVLWLRIAALESREAVLVEDVSTCRADLSVRDRELRVVAADAKLREDAAAAALKAADRRLQAARAAAVELRQAPVPNACTDAVAWGALRAAEIGQRWNQPRAPVALGPLARVTSPTTDATP